jgi:hypothetical protein
VVWVIAGLAAYVIGTMWYPWKSEPLTDLSQSWLGLAVAAAYSYRHQSSRWKPVDFGAWNRSKNSAQAQFLAVGENTGVYVIAREQVTDNETLAGDIVGMAQ